MDASPSPSASNCIHVGTNPTHPARLVVIGYLQEIQDHLVGLVGEAGPRRPRALGADLFALVVGGISLAVAHRRRAYAVIARDAAAAILGNAERD